MASHEIFRPAFNEQAANLPFLPVDPSLLPTPNISYGLPFPQACAKHVHNTFHSSRVYVICSGTLSQNSDALQRLIDALGKDRVVGIRKGMAPHTLWSQIIEIVTEAREASADCLVTLGAGSLTDGAKIVAMVRHPPLSRRLVCANFGSRLWQTTSKPFLSLLIILSRAKTRRLLLIHPRYRLFAFQPLFLVASISAWPVELTIQRIINMAF